jgi:hypothetical protein
MDFHHDISFRSILEDDSISSTFRATFIFVRAKKARLWLIVRSFIHLFHITHNIFTSALHFHFDLIQPLTFNLFMCECGHKLDVSNTH